MQKSELIKKISKQAGITLVEGRRVLEAIFSVSPGEDGIIAAQLKRGGRVVLPGFGVFEVKHRAGRLRRDPNTGEDRHLPHGLYPSFRPSNRLKSLVSGDQS